jgi:hypothetical protein
MEISVPQLDIGLELEPSQTDEKAKDHTGLVVFSTGLPGRFDYTLGDNATVGVGKGALIDLTGDYLLNLIFKSQGNLSNLLGGLQRLTLIVGVGRKHCDTVSCGTWPVLIMTYDGDVRPLRDDALRD